MTEVLLPPITVPELGDEYNQAVAETQDYLSLARSSRVQKQLVEKLTTLKDRIKGYKISEALVWISGAHNLCGFASLR